MSQSIECIFLAGHCWLLTHCDPILCWLSLLCVRFWLLFARCCCSSSETKTVNARVESGACQPTEAATRCCGSRNRYQNGTLVSGNMNQNLRNPSCLILSHTNVFSRGSSSFNVKDNPCSRQRKRPARNMLPSHDLSAKADSFEGAKRKKPQGKRQLQ